MLLLFCKCATLKRQLPYQKFGTLLILFYLPQRHGPRSESSGFTNLSAGFEKTLEGWSITVPNRFVGVCFAPDHGVGVVSVRIEK